MSTVVADGVNAETKREVVTEAYHERWNHWPVNWSAVWIGSLAAVAAVVIFGLIGVAIGAHVSDPAKRVVDLRTMAIWTVAYSVFASFLAFVIGGWVAGKVAGILRSEPGMLHGAVTWLTTLPLLLLLTGLGAGGSLGAWYGGLGSGRGGADLPFERPEVPGANATSEERTTYQENLKEYKDQVKQWREDTPKVTRNTALFAITALLLGLMGSVVGGWMASDEPMSLSYHRTRPVVRPDRLVRV